MRVLVIDDHPLSITVLSRTLILRGHRCMSASNIVDSLACMVSFQPDVVMYEWNLRAGGRGISKRLREAASPRTLYVIAVSTLDEPENFRVAEDVDAYEVKPFDAKRLERLLHR